MFKDVCVSQIGEVEEELQRDVAHLWKEGEKKTLNQEPPDIRKARFALVHPILAEDRYVVTKRSSRKDKMAS